MAERFRTQRKADSRYCVDASLSALEIHSANAMDPLMRAAFESRDTQTAAALDPILFEHRDMHYAENLELPLQL